MLSSLFLKKKVISEANTVISHVDIEIRGIETLVLTHQPINGKIYISTQDRPEHHVV